MEKNLKQIHVLSSVLATCALRKARDVRVFERVLALECVCQHAQSRSADDGYFRSVLCLGQQPVCRSLVVLMAGDKKKTVFIKLEA